MTTERTQVRLKDEIFSVIQYPAGEGHVTIKNGPPQEFYDKTLAVIWEARNYNDLCTILLASETWEREKGTLPFKIVVPYFPYARHDRRNGAGDSNPAQFAIDLIRDARNDIIIMDPHSDVTGALPHIGQGTIVRAAQETAMSDIIGPNAAFLIPDQGATKKTHLWLSNTGLPSVQGLKHRDPLTGNLSGFGIAEEDKELINGRDLIIVDDICDGGGTFMGLAGVIDNYASINLLVTHGLFTKGLTSLADVFDTITTLDIYFTAEALKWTSGSSAREQVYPHGSIRYLDTAGIIRHAILNNSIQ
jgi:ribose-phosphate pyrophosphokinase